MPSINHRPQRRFGRRLLLVTAATLACLQAYSAPDAPTAGATRYFKSAIPNAPFSAAVRVGEIVYLSGKIGIGADGTLPPEFAAQARKTMANVGAVIQQTGLGYEDVFKCRSCSPTCPAGISNKIYVTYFKPSDCQPVALSVNGLARGARLELDACLGAHGY
jgi:enamine deaminase RidA (YjgF/YER057c/UK114 family)